MAKSNFFIYKNKTFVLLTLLILFSRVNFAQAPSCPNLTVGPNASLCSGCTSISATLQGTKATTSYSVSSVPYTPFSFNTGTTVLPGIDDSWSNVINIPFCFEFYGSTYTQCVIGSNVVLSFDLSNGTCNSVGCNTWSINSAIPSATPADLTNCIMGPWHDIDPSVNSSSTPIINWKVEGTAPCRAFVVSWTDVSMYSFSCNSQLATSQIVLYETTNNIEIYIKDKPLCTGWNGGAAIEGIQNATGTQAVVVPGRNYPTQWSATNDGQRFTPTGAPQYTFTWYAPGNVAIGTTPTISVCPTTTTTYTATLVNNTCNGPITLSSPVTVNVTPPPCTGLPCSFSAIGDTVCAGGSISLTASTVTNATYLWIGPNGFQSTIQNPTFSNAALNQTGWYYVKDSITGCSHLDSVFVLIVDSPIANAGPDQNSCSEIITLLGTIGGTAIQGVWSGGAGTFSPNNTTLNCIYTPSSSEIAVGSVILTLSSNDPSSICNSVSDDILITIISAVTVNAGPDQTICGGNTVTMAASIIGAASGVWSGGTGSVNPNAASPTAIYNPSLSEINAGSVTLIYTANNTGSCPDGNDTVIITINQAPTANAGVSQYVCAGDNIALAGIIGGNNNNGSWSGGNGTYSPNNNTLNALYTPTAAEFAADSVTLTLTSNDPAGPCIFSSATVTHHFYELPAIDFTIDNPEGCPILCSNFTNLTTIIGGTIDSWFWSFGDNGSVSDLQNPSYCFEVPNYYDITLTAISNNACQSTLTKTAFVHVFNLPVAEYSHSPNPASFLDPAISFNDNSSTDVNFWTWSFGDSSSILTNSSNPIHVFPNDIPGTYITKLIVKNTDGCYDTIMHEIIIGSAFTFFIPNSFSPNGDELNDYFFGSGIGIIKYDLKIFDRWGEVIFHGQELNQKWDGKIGESIPETKNDVYLWKVELIDVFRKKHSYYGIVTIVK